MVPDGTVRSRSRSRSNSVQVIHEDTQDECENNRRAVLDLQSPRRLPSSLDQTSQDWSPQEWSWEDAFLTLDAPMTLFNNMSDTTGTVSGSGTGGSEISSATSVSACNSRLPSFDIDAIGNPTSPAPFSPRTTDSVHPFTPSQTHPPPPWASANVGAIDKVPESVSQPVSQPAAQEPIEGQRVKPKLDSRCILTLANIIITLENYLLSELRVLDLIISTVRSVTNEVRSIAQYQQETRSERCMFLFITIMYQVVTLLEVGSNTILDAEDERGGHGGLSAGPADMSSGFRLGAFSTFNAEEQRSWKFHVIRKECSNAEEMLAQLVALAKLGPNGAPTTPAQREERAQCFTGLQQRLKVLSSKVYTAT